MASENRTELKDCSGTSEKIVQVQVQVQFFAHCTMPGVFMVFQFSCE